MKALPVPVIVIFLILMRSETVEATKEIRFKVMSFGHDEHDYVLFNHTMSEFETGFTVCSWVRKRPNIDRGWHEYYERVQTWFSYTVGPEENVLEKIQIADNGGETTLFNDKVELRRVYTVTPGLWFHNCLSWDSATSTRDVYINGVKVDSKATPAGRKLIKGGTIVLGNAQSGQGITRGRWYAFTGLL